MIIAALILSKPNYTIFPLKSQADLRYCRVSAALKVAVLET